MTRKISSSALRCSIRRLASFARRSPCPYPARHGAARPHRCPVRRSDQRWHVACSCERRVRRLSSVTIWARRSTRTHHLSITTCAGYVAAPSRHCCRRAALAVVLPALRIYRIVEAADDEVLRGGRRAQRAARNSPARWTSASQKRGGSLCAIGHRMTPAAVQRGR